MFHLQLRTRNWQLCLRLFLIFLEYPGIFAAAALGAVDDQAPLAKRNPRQSAWHDQNFFPVEDIGPEVDAPSFKVIIDKAWVLAQFDDGLRDEVAGIGLDFGGKFLPLGYRRLVAHQHAISARLIGAFDDQL